MGNQNTFGSRTEYTYKSLNTYNNIELKNKNSIKFNNMYYNDTETELKHSLKSINIHELDTVTELKYSHKSSNTLDLETRSENKYLLKPIIAHNNWIGSKFNRTNYLLKFNNIFKKKIHIENKFDHNYKSMYNNVHTNCVIYNTNPKYVFHMTTKKFSYNDYINNNIYIKICIGIILSSTIITTTAFICLLLIQHNYTQIMSIMYHYY